MSSQISATSGNRIGSVTVTNISVTTPTIANEVIAAADTEQSYALPANSKQFSIRNRGNGVLKLAYAATESGTKYITIWPGATFERHSIDLVSLTLYFQCSKASDIIEIESWV